MKNKKIFIAAILFSVPLFSADNVSQESNNQLAAKNTKKNQSQQLADDPMMSQDPCSNLTSDEQNFAAKLNDANSMTFCSKMNSMQRQKAMQMSGVRGPSGTKMSPDDAVQNVMQNGGNSGMRQSGACPVQ